MDFLRTVFYLPTARIERPTALLVKVDAIGDYVLFRNFIEPFINDPKVAAYNWVFMCSPAVAPLAQALDGHLFSAIIPLDLARFQKSRWYRMKMRRGVVRMHLQCIVHPVLSRITWIDDFIGQIPCPKKIGSTGDASNSSREEIEARNSNYSELIPAREDVLFEFERNREFFQNYLKKDFSSVVLELPDGGSALVPGEYVVILPGSKELPKMWPPVNYAEVIHWLLSNTTFKVVICGGVGERELGKMLTSGCDAERVINACGNFTLLQMVNVLQHAILVVGNDTGLMHMRAAQRKPAVCISNGKEVLRFHPYPKTYGSPLHLCYPPELGAELEKANALRETYGIRWGLPISAVKPNEVIRAMKKQQALFPGAI